MVFGTAAKRFGYTARKWRIAKRIDADLAVLNGDPALDITTFAKVSVTIRAGRTIYKASSTPHTTVP